MQAETRHQNGRPGFSLRGWTRIYPRMLLLDNLGLCGSPLSIPCKHDLSSTPVLGRANEPHHELEIMWVYYSVIAGTVFGFWIWFGTLFFCKKWRFSFFSCIDAMQENIMQKMKCT
jgi:hypothetical protein